MTSDIFAHQDNMLRCENSMDIDNSADMGADLEKEENGLLGGKEHGWENGWGNEFENGSKHAIRSEPELAQHAAFDTLLEVAQCLAQIDVG